MKRIFLLLLLFEIGCIAQTDAKFKKIDSLLTFFSAKNKFMGSVALRENDKIVFAKAYGISDASNKKPNTNTKYKIGSITKIFTATIVIQLIEEKKLRYDDKLSKFYPKVKNADQITIEMLLRHRSGIHDFLADSITGANIMRQHTKTEIVERIANYQPDFNPDAKFEYSNSNYSLLGYIIEDVTQKTYAQNLDTRILKKLKLNNTVLPDHIEVSKNEAFSFMFTGSSWEQMPEWTNSLAFSAGAISSTPTDITAFVKALFDGKLIGAASLEKMKTLKDGYGLGLIALPFDRKFLGHTGGIENFRSIVGYNPEEKLGISVLMNGENLSGNDIITPILDIYHNKSFDFPNLDTRLVSAEILQSYAGTYSSASFPMKITISAKDGMLTAQATGQSSFPLESESDTKFSFGPAQITLEFSAGKMNLKQGGMNVDFTKE